MSTESIDIESSSFFVIIPGMYLPIVKDGVEGGTRTPTGLRPLEPESSASTNSATPT